MKENHYYVLTDSHLKQHIVRFVNKDNDKLNVYFVKDKEEKKLNADIKYYEAPLTHSHLNKLGFLNNSHQYLPIDGKYVFSLNAIGSSDNGLSFLLLGFSIVSEKDVFNFLVEFKDRTKEIITEKEVVEIQKKFNSSYSINNVLDNFNFNNELIDSIIID
ncbi:hypothetical protein [Chryseobacterium timonianum]|uniref:hypothetical protein n=1 Tax=Chryseobacterium timonianum TaxID=1805473 RepID=UPI00083A16AA|nr:hypothetical protein [Chryseobacterium timonianum]